MSSKLAPPQRVLIVGGGEFGATTALELARGPYKGQAHLITVLDRCATPPATDAASFDYNKVIRQEYSDPLYAKLARDAMVGWRGEWSQHYYESGVVVSAARDSSEAANVDKSLAVTRQPDMRTPGKSARDLPARKDVENVYPADVKLGTFADGRAYFNEAGGWANARGATEDAVAKCRAAGVQFRAGTAKELIIDERTNKVTGVTTAEAGDRHIADKVVLCMGAWTPTLVPELQEQCLPTGQAVAFIQLTPEEYERYKAAPATWVGDIGFYIFPPTPSGLLKFAIHQKGYLSPTDTLPSVPRTHLSRGYEFQRIPDDAVTKLKAGLARVYPEFSDRVWTGTRLCWYSDRPSGDFLFDYHPKYNNSLFVAAGCSGHAFSRCFQSLIGLIVVEFLPVIGNLIVKGLNGELPKEYADVFAFNHRVPSRVDDSRLFSQHVVLKSTPMREIISPPGLDLISTADITSEYETTWSAYYPFTAIVWQQPLSPWAIAALPKDAIRDQDKATTTFDSLR
ncbi:uncharacterized protein EHS24_002652 [Apiotrichum porosum]|uniref:FAD dependent oxidoreductase domain-containing protein n=1 Tax=Apiotrichum porosum TaxID=105984 RepID=A0A427XH90_9TREE|nr:uncharacterized protein EHS24_002652 [Apiotrichum porosum]RSH78192.1 hypothetical protein EHS24_002652 [Apiotrichum porosum]